ncbi:MAG: hypothetical protein V4712_00155 [Pseudomonadota bacterium]
MSIDTSEIDGVRRRMTRLYDVCTASLCLTAGAIVAGAAFGDPGSFQIASRGDILVFALILAGGLGSIVPAVLVRRHKKIVTEFDAVDRIFNQILKEKSSAVIRKMLAGLESRRSASPIVADRIRTRRIDAQAHLDFVLLAEEKDRDRRARIDRLARLGAAFSRMRASCAKALGDRAKAMPIMRAHQIIAGNTRLSRQQRKALDDQWQHRSGRLSWWGRMTTAKPDMTGLDRQVADMETARSQIQRSKDFVAAKASLNELQERVALRLRAAERAARASLPQSHQKSFDAPAIAASAFWLGAMSIPVSAWADIVQAGNVYDALRRVSSTYAGMSDADIWTSTLFLPAESLAGLTNLAKGAYFEALVAAETGGELFANFNHPATDITIDGVEYQIKATDSVSYIESVPDDIPVIATTEVAFETGAMDIGYSNLDLEQAMDLSLGGSVIDFGDTAVDAVLTGIGGLGLLATINGIRHAHGTYSRNGDAGQAIAEGAGVAIMGTAKTFVDSAELAYKVATSRPSRMAGRWTASAARRISRAIRG